MPNIFHAPFAYLQKNRLPIKVAIAESNKLYAIGIKTVVENHPFTSFCASFFTIKDLFDWYDGNNADIILIDVNLITIVTNDMYELLRRYENVKVIILASSKNQNIIQDMNGSGIGACLFKDIDPCELIQTIIKVRGTEGIFSQDFELGKKNDILLNAEHSELPLSKREIQVLELIALGKKNKEIGAILNLSPLTIKKHRENILKKMGANNTAQLISLSSAHHASKSFRN